MSIPNPYVASSAQSPYVAKVASPAPTAPAPPDVATAEVAVAQEVGVLIKNPKWRGAFAASVFFVGIALYTATGMYGLPHVPQWLEIANYAYIPAGAVAGLVWKANVK
jgi:hypothetical protein